MSIDCLGMFDATPPLFLECFSYLPHGPMPEAILRRAIPCVWGGWGGWSKSGITDQVVCGAVIPWIVTFVLGPKVHQELWQRRPISYPRAQSEGGPRWKGMHRPIQGAVESEKLVWRGEICANFLPRRLGGATHIIAP